MRIELYGGRTYYTKRIEFIHNYLMFNDLGNYEKREKIERHLVKLIEVI